MVASTTNLDQHDDRKTDRRDVEANRAEIRGEHCNPRQHEDPGESLAERCSVRRREPVRPTVVLGKAIEHLVPDARRHSRPARHPCVARHESRIVDRRRQGAGLPGARQPFTERDVPTIDRRALQQRHDAVVHPRLRRGRNPLREIVRPQVDRRGLTRTAHRSWRREQRTQPAIESGKSLGTTLIGPLEIFEPAFGRS